MKLWKFLHYVNKNLFRLFTLDDFIVNFLIFKLINSTFQRFMLLILKNTVFNVVNPIIRHWNFSYFYHLIEILFFNIDTLKY